MSYYGSSFRGRYQSRGHVASSGTRTGSYNTSSTGSYLRDGLDDEVEVFARGSQGGAEVVKITDVVPKASYSWLEGNSPTIRVPGAPPVWNNRNPSRVPQDQGLTYIDQNSARMGMQGSPLTPLFAAMKAMNHEDDLASSDLITDRNNLRKLLRWVTSAGAGDDFRIDVERVGSTCVFTRRDERDSTYIKQFAGFGHEYEKAATTAVKGCERATGHHRIVSLSYGGIKVLLRFEVDGCIKTPSAPVEDDLDFLTRAMQRLDTTDKSKTESHLGLAVYKDSSNALVPQSELIELKTRAAHKDLDWREVYPQLYLSQTGYLYLARHTKGTFDVPEKYALGSPSLATYAKQAESGMAKLKTLLRQILDAVEDHDEGTALSLVCERGRLVLYRRKDGTGKAIGAELRALFNVASK